ncbi:FHA domain-containing protein [Nocardia flavorosea]|uniref:FHA domain-containing protein n=1 Tax=Nocardia flavorosea TaxID=53429 RepID=UPI0018957F68|nr:FHA domain-containing protein [Nocardia flavorosea]MBF6351306.1 FHA domain-containing protein [Nocardia flavorosea]
MRIDTSTIGIAPGEGLVARFGDVVIYLVGANASTERILGAVEAVADVEHPGAAIAQRLAAVVFGTGSEPPPFGLVAPTADGTLVLLRGPVSALISGAEGSRRLVGARAFTWVDEIVRDPVRTLSVGPGADAQVTPYPRTDLRAGVVPGGGFVIHAAVRRSKKPGHRAAAAAPKRVAGEPPATAPAGLAAADPVSAADSGPRTGLATAHPAKPLPGTRAWSAAPARPVQDPIRLRKEPAKPRAHATHNGSDNQDGTAAVLVAEDGTNYPLDRAYVIGRGPSVDESIRRKTAAPLVLQRDRHISRVHAYLTVDAGKVYLRDAGTAAGTFVSTPDEPRWTRIGQAPTELPPGGRIRISEQVLTYRSETAPAD